MPRTPKPPRRHRGRGIKNNLKRFRRIEGVRRAELARAAEVSDRQIERIESGHGSTPETLHRLVNALNKLRTQRTADYELRQVFPNAKEE